MSLRETHLELLPQVVVYVQVPVEVCVEGCTEWEHHDREGHQDCKPHTAETTPRWGGG